MAKSSAAPQSRPQARPRRKQADAEHTTRLLVIGGVVAVLLVVAGIIAYGWYQTEIKPFGETVLEVGDQEFSLGHLIRRMKLMNKENTFYQGQGALQLPEDTLTQLENEAKMLQGASEFNLEVTDEEFAKEIKDRGGLAEDADPDLYATSFKDQVKESGLKREEFEHMVRAELMENKINQYFIFTAPANEPMVRANYVLTESEEKAGQIAERARAGEDFITVASQVAVNEANGTLEWSPRAGSAFLPEDVEAFLFDEAQPNQVSDPQESGGGFYVLQLLEKDPNRATDEQSRQQIAQREFTAWLTALTITSVRHFSDETRDRALTEAF
jgi:parvulin-like peptidyl-prolyl isomerase